jgi:hypothetical protein
MCLQIELLMQIGLRPSLTDSTTEDQPGDSSLRAVVKNPTNADANLVSYPGRRLQSHVLVRGYSRIFSSSDKAASSHAWLQSLRICVSSAPPLLPDTCQSLPLLAVRK